MCNKQVYQSYVNIFVFTETIYLHLTSNVCQNNNILLFVKMKMFLHLLHIFTIKFLCPFHAKKKQKTETDENSLESKISFPRSCCSHRMGNIFSSPFMTTLCSKPKIQPLIRSSPSHSIQSSDLIKRICFMCKTWSIKIESYPLSPIFRLIFRANFSCSFMSCFFSMPFFCACLHFIPVFFSEPCKLFQQLRMVVCQL